MKRRVQRIADADRSFRGPRALLFSLQEYRRATVLFAVLVLGALPVPLASRAQTDLVFASNYDAVLVVAGESSHITSRARVRNGSIIPIEFQRHRIDITVSEGPDGGFQSEVNVFEKALKGWHRVNADTLTFEGRYSAPLQFQWAVGDIALDLAMVVSMDRSGA